MQWEKASCALGWVVAGKATARPWLETSFDGLGGCFVPRPVAHGCGEVLYAG